MLLSDAPAKLTKAFATDGAKNVIPVPSQIPVTPGAASWSDGFPPLTMTAVAAGGVPPSGKDFNGIFNALSALDIWNCTGAGFPYDATFAAAIGGYPKGSRVFRADGLGYWISTVDANLSNPDTGGAGWKREGSRPVSSVYASAQQTLAAGNSKVVFDTAEFDDGLWDAANHRFTAPWAGRYRITGSVMLSAPDGQNLAAQVWKNGALAKNCFQAPQVSDVDLALPFGAVLNLAAGDYLEAYLAVSQTAVLAGPAGSAQAYVFAQCEYLGG